MMTATYGNRYGHILYERTMIATSVITYEVGKNTGFDTNESQGNASNTVNSLDVTFTFALFEEPLVINGMLLGHRWMYVKIRRQENDKSGRSLALKNI